MNPGELADRLAIQDVLNRYAELVDRREWTALDEVFTEDATVDYTSTGGQSGPLRPVMEWLARALEPWPLNLHFISNVRVELDGDRARARSYFQAPMGRVAANGSHEGVINAGTYRDELLRTAAGWRIRERVCEQVLQLGSLPPGYRIPD